MPLSDELLSQAVQLSEAGNDQEAELKFGEYLLIQPGDPEGFCRAGCHFASRKRPGIAAPLLERAVSLDPKNASAFAVLGGMLSALGSYDRALDVLNRALEIEPDMPSARWNRSGVNLTLGNWKQGWDDYEFGYLNRLRLRRTRLPEWRGENIPGKRLLVHSEQGFGDTIWALKMLPLIVERSQAEIILEVQEPLVTLVSESFPGIRVVAVPPTHSMPWNADAAVSLMSAAYALGLESDEIDAPVPYLKARPERVEYFKPVIGECRVGLIWKGRAKHENDHNRSIPNDALKPLAGVPFLGLQMDPGPLPRGLKVVDVSHMLTDFSVTAAIMASLDLVVTVDSAPVHLAGALGVPCALMLPKFIDFRWQRYEESCPWYPSVEIFRQRQMGEWTEVLERVKAYIHERLH